MRIEEVEAIYPEPRRARSHLQQSVYLQLVAAGMEGRFREEVRIHPVRRWRLDFGALPLSLKVGLEVDGGIWTGGRHTSPRGFVGDIEKLNHAALAGWLVVRAAPTHVESGQALRWFLEAIAAREREARER